MQDSGSFSTDVGKRISRSYRVVLSIFIASIWIVLVNGAQTATSFRTVSILINLVTVLFAVVEGAVASKMERFLAVYRFVGSWTLVAQLTVTGVLAGRVETLQTQFHLWGSALFLLVLCLIVCQLADTSLYELQLLPEGLGGAWLQQKLAQKSAKILALLVSMAQVIMAGMAVWALRPDDRFLYSDLSKLQQKCSQNTEGLAGDFCVWVSQENPGALAGVVAERLVTHPFAVRTQILVSGMALPFLIAVVSSWPQQERRYIGILAILQMAQWLLVWSAWATLDTLPTHLTTTASKAVGEALRQPTRATLALAVVSVLSWPLVFSRAHNSKKTKV